ncbi:nucleolar protein 11-like [Chanos chanos]|uniref:Nucleolar protein 11-like n=1 Tax=Chanos chanos TaxID=29144 RepID=A0A6J2VXG3_CHACN|nr:nucleolar protein 11 [Chanos chanos]
MAALYEGYTLCGLAVAQNSPESVIQGLESDRDDDHVVVTDSNRSVTVYKVSDQKPLGSWTVKQGQTLTCPAVYNTQTQEYVAVVDSKIIRVWKDDDISFDKSFKATVSADVYRVHSAPNSEPVVLFCRGAVRLLDSLLAAPQQFIEDVLAEEEVIRWSTVVTADNQQFVLFITEQKGEHLLYMQKFKPNCLMKYRLDSETSVTPLSFSATLKDGCISLLYLYPDGCVYQSLVQVRDTAVEEVRSLPRSLLLKLPIGEGELVSASAVPLDEAYIAVVGVPHPSAGAGKDYLCIWNTNFQTLQAGKEMAGRIYGQLWCYSGKLYVPHGKVLSVIPFECQKSSLAAALGKLKQSGTSESKCSAPVLSWNAVPQGDGSQSQGMVWGVETRRTKSGQKSKSVSSSLTVDQLLEHIKTASEKDIQKELETFLTKTGQPELQLAAGCLASELVTRSQAEPTFYPQKALMELVFTRCLCYSTCPDLLMLTLEKKDYSLCQSCLQLFPDIPEAVTCACLKTIISAPDAEFEAITLEPDSVFFMESLLQTVEPEPEEETQRQNGDCPPTGHEDNCEVPTSPPDKPKENSLDLGQSCPVGLHKAVLINEVLQTPYSDSFLVPHLKDLTVSQVILFLQYLQFLYVRYSQDVTSQIPALRSPTLAQIMDWVCLLLDAHFTVLVMAPEATNLLIALQKFVKAQMKLYSELGKIEGSLQALQKTEESKDIGQYSIEVIELI